jgi:hypothetical protein
VLVPHELPEQDRRDRRREHGAAGGDLAPVAGADADRGAAADQHALHVGAAFQPPAAGLQAGHERGGEPARAALGDGEAVLLREAAQDPAEQAAARRLRREVGVQRVAGQQPRRALPAEPLLGEAADGQQREAREPQQPGGTERGRQPRRAAQRRERPQQRVQERPAGRLPVRVELTPGRAVAGREALERGRGLVEVGRDRGTAAVRLRMGDGQRRAAPAQPVLLELERPDGRRRDGERVERAEQVAGEAGLGQLAALDGAARRVGRLEHEHAPAAVGQHVGGHQPVGTGADDDGVEIGGHGQVATRFPCWVVRVP